MVDRDADELRPAGANRLAASRRQAARYRAMFRTMALGIVYKNANGEIIASNPAAARILGMTRAEMRGRGPLDPCWRAVSTDGSPLAPEDFPSALALRTGRAVTDVTVGLHNAREGSHRWVEISAVPKFRRGAAQPHVVFLTLLDVTERRRAQEALHRSEAHFRSLIENASDLITILDADTIIRYESPSIERLLGYTQSELLGHSVLELVHPGDLAGVQEGLGAILRDPSEVVLRTVRIRAADGRYRMLEARARNLLDDPAVEGILVNSRDTTERVAAEEESRRRVRQHSAVATLGRRALDASLDELLDLAVTLVRDTIDADWGGICELSTDGSRIVLRACTGSRDDVGHVIDLDGRTLDPTPRIIEDITSEACALAEVISRLGLCCGVTVPIQGRERAFGVLGAHSRQKRGYTSEDLDFLQIMANILATAIEQSEDRRQIRLQADLLDRVGQAVIATDSNASINYWNRAAEALYGWSEHEVLGRSVLDIVVLPEFSDHGPDIVRQIENGEPWRGELQLQRKDGSQFFALVASTSILDAAGRVIGIVSTTSDLTEHRRLEDQLRQAQKMEAVGRLAGGVAHDFNNLLTAIQGHTEFLLDEFAEADPVRADLEQIRKAATRASALTRQLLAFSRKQVLQPRVIELQAVVRDMEKMLSRVIGEDITVVTELHPDALPVRVDPGQLEQVLLNLVVNARDAMPAGGRIGITVRAMKLTAASAESLGLAPGLYSMLEVSDTGCGMSAQVRAQIFEPFFTTKEVGKGTGLGLSTVYGIVQQSGGAIDVQSEPDHGAAFRVFLPAVEAAPAARRPDVAATPLAGTETILFVEDDDSVRSLASRVLRKHGYTVLEANGGGEALLLCERHTGTIHLLLTDIVMPVMSGREVAERLSVLRPDMRILYASGYTDDAILRYGVVDQTTQILEKPYSPEALLRRVRGILSAPPVPAC